MLMDCVTRRSIRRRSGNGLNLVPLEAGENERFAGLHKSHSFSAEELAKVHKLMSACDEDTCAHSWRIAYLAKEMACYLHLSSAEVCTSLLSALLHDIGKARMPRELLGKQGSLNAREWEVIRQQQCLPQQRLTGAVRNFGEEIGFFRRHQFLHGFLIPPHLPDARVPDRCAGRSFGLGPISLRPLWRDVFRVAAELQDVPLCDTNVFQQLPRRVLRTFGSLAAELRWKIRKSAIEIGVSVPAAEQF